MLFRRWVGSKQFISIKKLCALKKGKQKIWANYITRRYIRENKIKKLNQINILGLIPKIVKNFKMGKVVNINNLKIVKFKYTRNYELKNEVGKEFSNIQ